MTCDDELKQFRANLKAIREGLGLSQSELARRAGKQHSFICDLERGRRSPTMKTFFAISSALGIPAAALLSPRPKSVADRS